VCVSETVFCVHLRHVRVSET
ncbi:hypothetical protein QTP70_017148, partial [Hemibagrus guttatus]